MQGTRSPTHRHRFTSFHSPDEIVMREHDSEFAQNLYIYIDRVVRSVCFHIVEIGAWRLKRPIRVISIYLPGRWCSRACARAQTWARVRTRWNDTIDKFSHTIYDKWNIMFSGQQQKYVFEWYLLHLCGQSHQININMSERARPQKFMRMFL